VQAVDDIGQVYQYPKLH